MSPALLLLGQLAFAGPWDAPAEPVPAPVPAPVWGAPAAPQPAAAPPPGVWSAVVTPAAIVVAAPVPIPPFTRVTGALVLRVDDQAAASANAIALAEQMGGWFSRFSGDGVTVRIPTAGVDAFLEASQGFGDVEDRQYGREDLGGRIADVESRLKARREVLARYLSVLEDASPKAVVQVEREITRVVSEIEGLEGQLRVHTDRVKHAEVTLSFRYRERRAPVRDGSSSFAWLNTMNVADFLEELEVGWRGTLSRSLPVAPEGFAPFRRPGRFQAVSPDDVAFRVRSARNKPAAELGFWTEALESRMVAAGYRVRESGPVTAASGETGALLELGAANGEQDQTYLVAVFVDGRHLIIVEATGEADRFRARRDAVVQAVQGLSL
jgi:hypothetical protein